MSPAARTALPLAALLAALAGCSSSSAAGGPAPSTAKALTAFSFVSPAVVGVIDEETRTIRVTVPAGTTVTALVATFGSTGVRVSVGAVAQVSGTTPGDFTSPVDYVVTAADGGTAAYRVTVTVCGAHTTATPGACDCVAGFGDCDDAAANGCELPLSSDPVNCGACGNVCPSGVCGGGACHTATCGDGIVRSPETCDPGTGAFTATCNINCTSSTCGDGIVNGVAGEECDPGGTTDTAACLMASGAGVLRCKVSTCGDGYPNAAAGEQCDTSGLDTPECNGRICRLASCGDGYVNGLAGEECDPGTAADTASCVMAPGAGNLRCKASRCGDAHVNVVAGEHCDNGPTDSATCNGLLCTWTVCGDGYTNRAAGEECDSGGVNTPGCIGSNCKWSRCGDGIVNAAAGEQCDSGQGNGSPGNCCTSTCQHVPTFPVCP